MLPRKAPLKTTLRAFALRVNRLGVKTEIDRWGRVLIHKDLRSRMNLEGEVIIKSDLCKKKELTDHQVNSYLEKFRKCESVREIGEVKEEIAWEYASKGNKEKLEVAIEKKVYEIKGKEPPKNRYRSIGLKLDVPIGKLGDIARVLNYIKSKFEKVNIKVEISSKNGEILTSDYEDKIKEAFMQANVDVEEEELE